MNKTACLCALLIGILHFIEYYGISGLMRNMPITYQKAVALRTENGFYYSFYDRFVNEPSIIDAFRDLLEDKLSEHPHTLNALQRFNVYQEMIVGILYRSFGYLIIEPWYFFFFVLHFLNALGHAALVYVSVNEGGSPLCGVLTALFLYLNRGEISRIWNYSSVDLREFWGLPVLWIQILCLLRAMKHGRTKWFIFTTFAFMLMWQFGSYVLTLQASAVFATYLLGFHPQGRQGFTRMIDAYLIATIITIIFLFGNWLLVTNIFLSMLVAVRIVLFLPRCVTSNSRVPMLINGAIQGILALGLFVVIRMLIKPYANADSHIFEIICGRVDWFKKYLPGVCPPTTSFNASLYLSMGVFNIIEKGTIDQYKESGVFYAAAGTLLCIPVVMIISKIIKWRSQRNVEPKNQQHGDQKKKKDTNTTKADASKMIIQSFEEYEDGKWIFLVFQFILFVLLGVFINRLRAVFGPVMCVFASLACGTSLWGKVRIHWIIPATLAVGYIAYLYQLVPCGMKKNMCNNLNPFENDQGDIIELSNFINTYLDEKDAVATSMNLSGTLRDFIKLRTIIHPHFEDNDLRERVQDLYENLYHCLPPQAAHEKLGKLQAKYLIIEQSRCILTPFHLDKPRKSCKNNEQDKLLCRTIILEPKYFKPVFANGEFFVYERQDVVKDIKPYKSFGAEGIWKDLLENCKPEEDCEHRLAEIAQACFNHQWMSPAISVIMKMIEKSKKPAVLYTIGRIHDYKTNEKKLAYKYYKKAFEADPTELIIAKEYLVHLEINNLDQKEAQKVAKVIEKIPVDENKEIWWTSMLEAAMTFGPKTKKGAAIFKKMKEENPLSNLLESYWSYFTDVPMNKTRGFDDWGKLKSVFIDHAARSELTNTSGPSLRQQKYKLLFNN